MHGIVPRFRVARRASVSANACHTPGFDGIVLHQILQWHHMLTDAGDHPSNSVAGLEANTRADGFFHLATWFLGRHGDAADAPRGAATRVGAAVARSRGDRTRPTGVATDQQTTPDIRSRPRQPAGYSTDGRFERRAPTPTPRAGDRAPRARDRNL
jgi:hypothetical protein